MTAQKAPKQQIPAVKGWFTMPPQEPRLIASRCKSCGHYAFPKATTCRNPDCPKAEPLEEALLSRRGKLWTYTINYYSPPPPYHAPTPFVPFGVAVVELPEGLKVQGQIATDCDLEALKVGMEMELIIEKLYEDDQGNEVVAWKFKPTQGKA